MTVWETYIRISTPLKAVSRLDLWSQEYAANSTFFGTFPTVAPARCRIRIGCPDAVAKASTMGPAAQPRWPMIAILFACATIVKRGKIERGAYYSSCECAEYSFEICISILDKAQCLCYTDIVPLLQASMCLCACLPDQCGGSRENDASPPPSLHTPSSTYSSIYSFQKDISKIIITSYYTNYTVPSIIHLTSPIITNTLTYLLNKLIHLFNYTSTPSRLFIHFYSLTTHHETLNSLLFIIYLLFRITIHQI